MTPVKSSNIEAIGYDNATGTLKVKFKGGGLYHYENVSATQFEAFLNAESHGKHFHANFKSKRKTPF